MKAFGYFKGMPYKRSNEDFEEYRKLKNSIPKDKVIKHIETLELGLTTLPSYEMFTGEELQAGAFWDGDFVFPYEFLHYYKNYDIGIPYDYEAYLRDVVGIKGEDGGKDKGGE